MTLQRTRTSGVAFPVCEVEFLSGVVASTFQCDAIVLSDILEELVLSDIPEELAIWSKIFFI